MNNIHASQGQPITISNNGITSVVATSSGMLVGRVANVEEEDEEDNMADDDEDSFGEDDEMMGVSDVTSQLAAAGWRHGPVGVAAAAAIASSKRKRKSHTFETNPSIRKRQQTRLLRKLKAVIDEFSVRVGQQAIVLVATPGKTVNNFRAFGAKPLEDVVRNLKSAIMTELETALSQQAPPPSVEDPNLHELPPIVIDGIPTPVEKMTQAQLRAFIPLMLKYSTGRGKPGWGKESTKPPWWPKHVPWANVRMDARNDEEKSKQISWTHALREIVINCYKYHGREDLLPKFSEEEDIKRVQQVNNYGGQTVVQTISNPDGSVSIIHVDPNNPVITLSDGTTAQVQLHDAGSVHTLAEVATSDSQVLQGTHEIQTNEHGHILITGEDGNAYPVQVSGHQLVTVNPSIYQTVVANIQGGSDGQHVQVVGTPIQLSGLSGNLQGLVMKTEPGEAGGGGGGHSQGLTITPVSLPSGQSQHTIGLGSQHFSVLQMAEGGQQIITMRQKSPDHRENTPDTTS